MSSARGFLRCSGPLSRAASCLCGVYALCALICGSPSAKAQAVAGPAVVADNADAPPASKEELRTRLRAIDLEIRDAEMAGRPLHYQRRRTLGVVSGSVAIAGAGVALGSVVVALSTGAIVLGIDHSDEDEARSNSSSDAWFLPTVITGSVVAAVGAISAGVALITRRHPNSQADRIRALQQDRRRLILDFKRAQREKRLELAPAASLGRSPSASWTLRVRF